jgi:transcriptional regulator with GAF, ATPase, and Fis domain
MAATVLSEGQQRYIPDVMHGADTPPSVRRAVEVDGNHSIVMTPMLWEGKGIGTIAVMREPNAAFNAKELSLLRTFADQAVIAIQNARLFNEVQAKTRDLQESLQQQTATADVLKVISRSTVDLETVLNTLAETVTRLCRADYSTMYRRRDDKYHLVALHRDFDWFGLGQSSSGSWAGSTRSSMLRGVLGCLLMKPSRSSVSTIW